MDCRTAQPLLSEYIDNTLSARQTWDLDRHLGLCHECTRLLNELRRTADLTAAATRFEVSADFMNRLQSRLSNVEPKNSAGWLQSVRTLFRPRILPAWGAAVATCALVVILLAPRNPSVHGEVPSELAKIAEQAQDHNLALSTADPFADTAAANLAAHISAEPAGVSETIN